MFPLPFAVKEPIAARKLVPLYPLRLNAYCPLSTDSLPVPQADALAATVTLSACVLLCSVGEVESFTCTVKFEVPAAVGVPESTPAGLKASHDGSEEPEATLHV